MIKTMPLLWLVCISLILLIPFSVVDATTNNIDRAKSYIVRVENHLKPSAFASVEHWYESMLNNLQSTSEPTPGFLYIYRTTFQGFATRLTSQQVEQLQKHPEIIGIYPDKLYKLHTTRTPTFLGLYEESNVSTSSTRSRVPGALVKDADGGSNVIVGVLDTGIWPERESFSDEGLSPVPTHWKGVCEGGANFSKSLCNKKLVGVRYFSSGFEAIVGRAVIANQALSARDEEGHGTHTASTIAGKPVSNVSFLGYAKGEARGIAHKARIAAYKVCWPGEYVGCPTTDILAAMDKAVEDGVDIISLSLGGPPQPYEEDPIAISTFHAIEQGIFVSASAGNDGPSALTVSNGAPWITTIGSSSLDRKFTAHLELGNGDVIIGESLYQGKLLPPKQFFPLLSVPSCEEGFLDPSTVKGKIVVCDDQKNGVVQSLAVKKAGGVGVVVANRARVGEAFNLKPILLPGLYIPFSQYEKLLTYLANKGARAAIKLGGTTLGFKPAPVVSYFSSRGPSQVSKYLLKPDVIAPGSLILAAWTDSQPPTLIPEDPRRTKYNIISGTSMSCPHASGLAALLKGAHPNWSPAIIRSALMTTAYTHGNDGKPILEGFGYQAASTWDYGAGHVNPVKANDPGLVYDLTVDDYIDFLCASNVNENAIKAITKRSISCEGKNKKPWDLNYPAIVVPSTGLQLDLTITRTVTQVGKYVGRYAVKVKTPEGVTVSVDPPQLQFEKAGQKKSFKVRISGERSDGSSTTEVGSLTWSDGTRSVRSPIIVLWEL